ncbi:AAA family ATPase, partial [Prevotella sp.]
ILLRGARQVGKSSAVRHLGKQFKNFLEINFEMEPQYKVIFQPDLNVNRIVLQISAISGSRIEEGEKTLQAQTYILIFGNVASYLLLTRT